jgi:3'-phosphoadenosine 5'-phosphosulfate sulfotransferase (PAPS reductase)/FAD synthetase
MPVRRPDIVRPNTTDVLPANDYETIIVSFSGGKDSMACVLHLLDQGVPPERIELWHQSIDGRPGDAQRFFDWPVTEAYCQAFADAFKMKILFQWKEEGFRGEMLRDNEPTKPTSFQLPHGREMTVGGRGKPGTRRKFPQVAADLRTRWCTAYLKIDVASKVFSNDPRFKNGCLACMLTGERRQESAGRARYANADRHKSTTMKRRVDQWRAVIDWTEEEVWEIIERYNVRPHPCYYLGWSRCSCISCIFGNPDQWASMRHIDRELFRTMEELEETFGVTLRRDGPLGPCADRGLSSVDMREDRGHLELAMTGRYDPDHIFFKPSEPWQLPKGAYGESGGPV